MSKKVALGMSGGVDSSLCAHLLAEQGYEVTGVFLECWRAPGCPTDENRADALKVALSLDLPFRVLDFKDAYKQKVVEYFFEEYESGRTPNPDVMCNQEIKFGLFYDWAMENGFDYVATGHYAQTEDGHLYTPKDEWKDQTYFLYRLTAEQLKHTLFPLAEMTKDEVRATADKRKIHVAKKPDSVGICFIGDINVKDFLKDRLGEKPGDVVDMAGNVVGKHQGVWFYTIGQRHGFELLPKAEITKDGKTLKRTELPPLFVIGKDAEKNQLVVGFEEDLDKTKFEITDIHQIQPISPEAQDLFVRIRHTGEMYPATIKQDKDSWQIELKKSAKGVAPGQSAVVYQKHQNSFECLGGGVII